SLTVGGSIALAIVLTLLPQLGVNLLGAVLIVIFGFFFATVSSRICGQIGSSANPISGMTIAALLGTCLIFVAIGWTGVDHRVQALSIAAFTTQSRTPPPGGRAPVEVLPATLSGFRIAGGDSVDQATYQVVRVYVVTQGVAAGKYLMDPATRQLRYVLDPGIGGRIRDY